jgi:hypothetical protein
MSLCAAVERGRRYQRRVVSWIRVLAQGRCIVHAAWCNSHTVDFDHILSFCAGMRYMTFRVPRETLEAEYQDCSGLLQAFPRVKVMARMVTTSERHELRWSKLCLAVSVLKSVRPQYRAPYRMACLKNECGIGWWARWKCWLCSISSELSLLGR